MTKPIENNQINPSFNSKPLEPGVPVDPSVPNTTKPDQSQSTTPPTIVKEILQIITMTGPLSPYTLQQRITLLQSLIGQQNASGNGNGVNAANWTLIVLHFFFEKLSDAAAALTQNPSAENDPQRAQAKDRKEMPQVANEAATNVALDKKPEEARQKELSFLNTQLGSMAKQELADTIVKSLLILQAGKLIAEPQGKEAKAQGPNLTSHIELISHLSKMVAKVEELKILLQDPKIAHPKALLSLVQERLEGTVASFGAILANPELVEKMVQDRLHQDELLLNTLINAAKQQIAPTKNLGNAPVAAPSKTNETLNLAAQSAIAAKNLSVTRPIDPANPAAIPAAKSTNAPVSPILRPANSVELAGLIQNHVSKGIMQPLPIIVPFPVTITMEEALGNNTSSSIEKEKRAKNEEGGTRGGSGGGNEFSILTMLLPPGPVIYGDHLDEGRNDEKPYTIEQLDAYLIAAAPVTNAQYAAFLNEALEQNAVRIEMPGKIYDIKSRLLVLTIEGAPLSQLDIAADGGRVIVRPIYGKENHPVVHVTYDGALAYCAANGFRLPTEAEWERAAGMMPTEYGQPLKKLRYGNGSDSISSADAVYKEQGFEKVSMNMTLPVGFFDGQKVYTKAGKRVETRLSLSPWGCSDMSGNAREWTCTSCDDEDYLFATKGGSYADTAFDLRVAAKIPLPRHTSDPYTSFRVAL